MILPPVRSIVVGVDGSGPSATAVAWALRIAAVDGAAITAVTAWHLPAAGVSTATAAYRPDEDAAEILRTAVEAAGGAPGQIATRVEQGYPAHILIEAGKDADLLIVGNRGHGGFAGLNLGSTSAACVQHATCPVLIARELPAEIGRKDD